MQTTAIVAKPLTIRGPALRFVSLMIALLCYFSSPSAIVACTFRASADSKTNAPFQDLLDAIEQAIKTATLPDAEPPSLSDLQVQSKKGFAVIDTESFFPAEIMQKLFDEFPKPATIPLISYSVFRAGEILSEHAIGEMRLPPNVLTGFQKYLRWLTDAINRELPENDQVVVAQADLRVNAAGGERNAFLEWHQDGFYLAAAAGLLGPGTEYLLESPYMKTTPDRIPARYRNDPAFERTPTGQTLVFSCTTRYETFRNIAPTLHRSPNDNGDRLFLIVRFNRRQWIVIYPSC